MDNVLTYNFSNPINRMFIWGTKLMLLRVFDIFFLLVLSRFFAIYISINPSVSPLFLILLSLFPLVSFFWCLWIWTFLFHSVIYYFPLWNELYSSLIFENIDSLTSDWDLFLISFLPITLKWGKKKFIFCFISAPHQHSSPLNKPLRCKTTVR